MASPDASRFRCLDASCYQGSNCSKPTSPPTWKVTARSQVDHNLLTFGYASQNHTQRHQQMSKETAAVQSNSRQECVVAVPPSPGPSACEQLTALKPQIRWRAPGVQSEVGQRLVETCEQKTLMLGEALGEPHEHLLLDVANGSDNPLAGLKNTHTETPKGEKGKHAN